ncbi:unnamed protein product, partial [Arabidopsis halleri]
PFGLRVCRGCGSVLVVVLWLVGSRRRARFVYWSGICSLSSIICLDCVFDKALLVLVFVWYKPRVCA